MVAQNVFQRASSPQIIDLWRFADRCNIPWNLRANFHSDLISTMRQEVPSFTLRTALSAIPFVSDLCGVDVQWFQERSSTGFAEVQGIVSVNDFRFPIWLQELLQASLGFLWSFCFARIRLDPFGGQVLHHDCISMIVSRFTTFTENFVIRCYQVTKIFCTRYGSASASSARGSCNFGPCERSRNFGLSGSEYKHYVYPNPHFS